MSEVFARIRDGGDGLVPWPEEAGDVPAGTIFDALRIRPTHLGRGAARAEMELGPQHLNQRGLCQGGALVTLADAVAGWATYCLAPDGHAFTTLELHSNLLGTARLGDSLVAIGRTVHAGRRTAVIEVQVMRSAEEERPAAERRLTANFTCTQLFLPPAGT